MYLKNAGRAQVKVSSTLLDHQHLIKQTQQADYLAIQIPIQASLILKE